MSLADQNVTVVPVDMLDRLYQKLESIEKRIESATITPAPKWVSIKDASEHFGVNRSTIHRWIEDGKLTAKGAGRARRVYLDAV